MMSSYNRLPPIVSMAAEHCKDIQFPPPHPNVLGERDLELQLSLLHEEVKECILIGFFCPRQLIFLSDGTSLDGGMGIGGE